MLTCQFCIRRHVQGFLEISSRSQVKRQANLAGRNEYSTATAILRDEIPAHFTSQPHQAEGNHAIKKADARYGTKALYRQQWLQSRGKRPSTKSRRDLPDVYETKRELVWLGDPLKLAAHTLSILRKGRFDEAEHIVRSASKNIQCIVSWNHLVDWQMSEGKVNGAIKTYNEMKKRGQTPDAHTYTILFRGLAEYSHYPEAISKALSIYHSMDAENSPVQPNVIHTNAVLKVCARAGDMDALFGVAAKLRRKGLRAPNNLTFTIILNAIRQHASKDPEGTASIEEVNALCAKAVVDARRMWDEIVGRWRQGDIWIDEELVCSMGRILLLGQKQDVDDIFSLIEQTMDIPRFVPPLGTTERKKMEPSLQGKPKPVTSDGSMPGVDEYRVDLVHHNAFKRVNPPTPSTGLSLFVKPGSNSLSLVLQALYSLRMKRSLAEYWEVFTRTHQVKPDSQNFHSYLRSLRVHRASQEALELLLKMPSSMLEKKTFRIAMSTCVRDGNNPGVFATAGKVLDLMQQTLAELDLATLHFYLEVAKYGSLPSGRDSAGRNESPYARGRLILRALERLGPAVINVRSALAYSQPATSNEAIAEAKVTRDAALALLREMISAYDKLVKNGMVANEMHEYLIGERSKLSAFLTRYNNKKPKGPNLLGSQLVRIRRKCIRSQGTKQ